VSEIVFIAKESDPNEGRVAGSVESVKKLKSLGFDVVVEAGAGLGSRIPDQEYEKAGARVGTAADAKTADVILKVRRPSAQEISGYRSGAVVIAIMDPYGNEEAISAMAGADLTTFAMELMPRITRAQSMDVLSSQANLAGYQAVIDAAYEYDRALQAGNARRLGAVVSATDVRPAAKEQVASLGAKFIAVEDEEFKAAETAGGYAKEMSREYQVKQAALVAEHIAKQDIVITTALIPGRPAPRLVTREMLDSMKPGSVVVDLAVERGGNIEGAEAGKVTEVGGVRIVGHLNVAGRIAASASLLYAKNLVTFLETMVSKETKALALNMEDELVKATALTHGGAVVHPAFGGAMRGEK
jgi:H+-translocating NAD(P) transhydrogenase subunit alpha